MVLFEVTEVEAAAAELLAPGFFRNAAEVLTAASWAAVKLFESLGFRVGGANKASSSLSLALVSEKILV